VNGTLRTTLLLLVALPSLAYGSYLIYEHAQSRPPDPATAPPSALVDFILSRHFAALSPEEKKKFLTEATKRLSEMSDEESEHLKAMMARFKEERGNELRDTMMKIAKDMMVSEARQLVKIPPQDRAEWIDSRMDSWMAMMPRGPRGEGDDADREERRRRRQEEREQTLTPERQKKVIEHFQKRILPRTSAEERALVMTLMKEAAPRFAERFGK